jgi:hypothetical protein
MPLDDLVVRVYHLELSECKDFTEFKESVQLLLKNVDEVLDTLGCYQPIELRVSRAIDRVKKRAISLKSLCAEIPESFDDPEGWRGIAAQIIANYEQFRIEQVCSIKLPCQDRALECCELLCKENDD